MRERLSEENFVVRAVHPVAVEVAFTVMTEPGHLTHFWGPTGTRTPVEQIVVDLRPGGSFETTMINELTGETHTMRAVYIDVHPPHRLSWRDDLGVVTELTFRALDDTTTEVTTTQRGLPPALRTPQARAGWATALERNAHYLTTLRTDHTTPPTAPPHD